MRKLKIGLVHAPNQDFAENQNYGLKFSPVWAFVLSTYIRHAGHESRLYDQNVQSRAQIEDCDAFFLSGINQDLPSLLDMVKYLRSEFPNKKLFLGGPICWSFDQASELERLSVFDHICIGDGELLVPIILDCLQSGKKIDHIIRVDDRFDLKQSLAMDGRLIKKSYGNYYGAVIEVSRGCPFLCEFCDIRVLPDNNRSHNRSIDVILDEIDTYRKLGVKNIQFACDNFIGDLEWAESVVNAIVEYNRAHNYSPSFYTWVTINIANYDTLMESMRIAGFDNLFIGVESFESNTLLETAKLQNTKFELTECLTKIQSYGFVVVAGLIFGFDSDNDGSFDSTLRGIKDTGLLSGDASLLTALPGTPLFRRMRLSGRLRKFEHDAFLGGHKYVTNIKYLMSSEQIIDGYIKFSRTFLSGMFQYSRLEKFYSILTSSGRLVNISRPGYTNVNVFVSKALRDPQLFLFHLKRLVPLLSPWRVSYLVRAFILATSHKIKYGIGYQYFVFWLFIWVNALNKYGDISPNDFNIESVPEDFDIRQIIPPTYLSDATEKIPQNKISAQYKATVRQLKNVILLKSLSK